MKKTVAFHNIICVFALISIAAGIFFCITKTENVAVAGSPINYSLTVRENEISVSDENGVVYSASKTDFSFTDMTAAINRARNGADFTFDIGAPSAVLTENEGKTTISYNNAQSQRREQFDFTAAASHFLSSYGVVEYNWYYKTGAGEFRYLGEGYKDQNTLGFGAGLNAGEYTVKVETVFKFRFDSGHIFTSQAYAEFDCSIVAGDFDINDVQAVAVYGSALSDARFNLNNIGDWTLSDENYSAEDTLDAGVYTIKYDFVPNSENYKAASDVNVEVTVRPFKIRIQVDDKTAVENKASKELTYTPLFDWLPFNKTVDDLGITLTKAAGNAPGEYKISGTAANGNFDVTFVSQKNPDSDFSVGGTYTILPVTLSEKLDNGAVVTIERESGFSLDAKIIFEKISDLPPDVFVGEDRYVYNKLYKISLSEKGQASEMGGVKVSVLQNGSGINADTLIFVFDDGGTEFTVENQNSIFINNLTEIGFLSKYSGKVALEDWNWATIALAFLIAAELSLLAWYIKRYNGGNLFL